MISTMVRGTLPVKLVTVAIIAVALTLSVLFFSFYQQLNQKVEQILQSQFNQQQLELARKIADNVEAYFDYLENEMLAYPWRFQLFQPDSLAFKGYMAARLQDMQRLGILEIRLYNPAGLMVQGWGQTSCPSPLCAQVALPPNLVQWLKNPGNRGRLYLSKASPGTQPPYQGRLVMSLYTALYTSPTSGDLQGVLELMIDPLFIANTVIQGVRSGETGYPWIINQDGMFLSHYEKDFVGHDAIKIRLARNPKLHYEGIKELHERIFQGQEGTGRYVSGWHRQKLGEMLKIYGFTTIRFDKGLIRNVTTVEDPAHNLWGVAVVAPVEEVSGQVGEVLHQEVFLVAIFLLVILATGAVLIGMAMTWNRALSREVKLKTDELLASQERLVRSERFAAVGEAAAYVSHEIKNPLMVIGGLARQIGRRLAEDPGCQEKLHIIQNEVRRLENFLGELRDFTRPALPVIKSVDLNRVIQDVQTMMETEARERHIKLHCHLDPYLPVVEADANQMKQVLLNFVKNALEATDSGGEVILRSGSEDQQVWFTVQDTGAGMSPDTLEKIFNPFFTTKDRGSGLGLSVINKIISDHHGTVAVASRPGEGSSFTVKIPSHG